jgi:hypothetical protein
MFLHPQAELSADILPVQGAENKRTVRKQADHDAAVACKESLALTGIKFEVKSCISSRKLPRKTASPGESSSFQMINSASLMKEVLAEVVEEPHSLSQLSSCDHQPQQLRTRVFLPDVQLERHLNQSSYRLNARLQELSDLSLLLSD